MPNSASSACRPSVRVATAALDASSTEVYGNPASALMELTLAMTPERCLRKIGTTVLFRAIRPKTLVHQHLLQVRKHHSVPHTLRTMAPP
ncbi:hypothetical protein BIV25_33960 [Streptomyces sp. MUSC 14]|nr:hypothetical protein BIV25_33960 [Streptomyces sp. MUSC 14]